MSMQPGHYSVNALASEFPPSQRTWAKYLADVVPSKEEGRTKYYRLADAIKAMPPHLLGITAGVHGDDDLDLNYESARLKRAQADKTEIEIKVLGGSLVPAELAQDRWDKYTANLRARLLALPETAAPRVTGQTLQRAVAEIRDLVYNALEELRDYDPRDYRPSIDHGRDRAEDKGGPAKPAASADSKPVGRRKPGSKQRGKRGAW